MDVQRFKSICKECKTPAAMPGFLFEQTVRTTVLRSERRVPFCNATLKKKLSSP
jgi:hypothetical protein